MTKQLESGMYSLAKLFSQEFFFRIPEYQRPFMWDKENFSNLIGDLLQTPWDEPYFLGTLVLHKQRESEYDVVDGQQRLTALCILIACLRDALFKIGEPKLSNELHAKIFQPENTLDSIPAKNRLQVKDQAVFNELISMRGGAASPLSEHHLSKPAGQRYNDARELFWAALDELTEERLRSFAIFVNKSCTLMYLATDSFEDAFRLFTVVNDRGKQLRRIDVLKAYNVDPVRIPNADARLKYAHQWEDMENQLGESRFEDMFHLLRLIYVKDKPAADLHKEFINRILGKPGMPRPGSSFMDDLTKFVDLYDRLFVDQDYLDSGATLHVEYRTLMAAMVEHFPASEWRACLLLFADTFGKNDLYTFLLELEKVYLDQWVRGVRKDERYGTYTGILKKIAATTDAGEVITATRIDTDEIQKACRANNFYGAGYAKYLLVRAEIVTSELDHPHQFQARSIEHVLPQNPKPGGTWSSTFTSEEHSQLVNTVGNLVLLSKSKNSAAGRREFADKKTTYLENRVSDFPRSVQVLSYPAWTPDDIRTRTEDFAQLVLRNP
ncbi:DUF262 domain-containing protein [Actinoplanes awajinensis]|uniref:DUF262 domain-containing protein n=1 Tax=Actinoplanes awajinensis subsp. mycoplanecinus TaxID=135947 RepID=A0A0X3UQ22_9ACTN|nr:DUF262 domain-containing protein [Actinoplanes awajinensis]KUL34570.1 hypothetical protein ADL15_15990 [Actinoplanes awajinensis subsp. mycoplanecinus]